MDNEKLSSSLEDYLVAIYRLCLQDESANANQIAQTLSVSKSSVTWALNQLSEKGYVFYTPYEPIRLTDMGQQEAQRLYQRHQLIKEFLQRVLGVAEDMAEDNACKMEHVIDHNVLNSMGDFSRFLAACPRAGQSWLDHFRYQCRHSSNNDKCTECVNTIQPEYKTPVSYDAETQLPHDQEPKQTKDRDTKLIERLKQILADRQTPFTNQQVIIAECFMDNERHFTLEELTRKVQQENPDIQTEEVQAVLDILCDYRLARAQCFNDQLLYEHFHPESHHDHFYCMQCGSVQEFFDPRIESLQMENARHCAFRPLQHTLNIVGICSNCIEMESNSRTLTDCRQGERVQVTRLTGDRDTQSQLTAMGLRRGVPVEVLNDHCVNGGMILLVQDMRIMLDKDLLKQVRIAEARYGEPLCRGPLRRRHRHRAERPGWPGPSDHYDESYRGD